MRCRSTRCRSAGAAGPTGQRELRGQCEPNRREDSSGSNILLVSNSENNIVSTMENKDGLVGDPAVTREGAEEALRVAAQIDSAAQWRPRRWAAIAVALAYAPMIAAASWERFWWVAGFFVLLGVLVFLLRHRLWSPLARARPWAQLDAGEKGGRWLPSMWPLWMPMTILVPEGLAWIGGLLGVAAGIHAYLGMRDVGGASL